MGDWLISPFLTYGSGRETWPRATWAWSDASTFGLGWLIKKEQLPLFTTGSYENGCKYWQWMGHRALYSRFFGQILKLCAQMPISVDRRSPGAKTGMGAMPKFGAQVVPMMAWTPGEMAHVSCSPLAASHWNCPYLGCWEQPKKGRALPNLPVLNFVFVDFGTRFLSILTLILKLQLGPADVWGA